MADSSQQNPSPFMQLLIWLRRIILTVCIGYGAVMFVLLFIWIASGEDAWWGVNLFVTLMPGTLVPGFIVLVISLLLLGRTAILINLPVLVIFASFYGTRLLPQDTSALPADFTVMTYNIAEPDENFEELWALMQDVDADIVAFQEFTPRIAGYLDEASAEMYPYRLTTNPDCSQGRAVYSRYPISENCIRANRTDSFQRMTIDVDGRELVLYNVHMPPPEFSRTGFYNEGRPPAIQALLERAQKETLPVLIMGDFNMGDMNTDYLIMESRYTDAFKESGQGLGLTYPVEGVAYGESLSMLSVPQFVRLDYIFHTDELRSLETDIPTVWRSDHLPLHTGFIWTGSE